MIDLIKILDYIRHIGMLLILAEVAEELSYKIYYFHGGR